MRLVIENEVPAVIAFEARLAGVVLSGDPELFYAFVRALSQSDARLAMRILARAFPIEKSAPALPAPVPPAAPPIEPEVAERADDNA